MTTDVVPVVTVATPSPMTSSSERFVRFGFTPSWYHAVFSVVTARGPMGPLLDLWNGGRYFVWDFICPDTLAPSHLSHSSMAAGSAAVLAETNKRTKYAALSESTYIFAPVAIRDSRGMGTSCSVSLRRGGGRIATLTGDIRAGAFLRQRLNIAVQRGNAAAVVGTHPHESVLQT